MKYIRDIFKGIAIGAGAILPGISSGVLCVIFGIYEKLVNSILDIFHDFKSHLRFLLPLFIGGILGVIAFGNLLSYLFASFEVPTKFIFMGLILGSIPALFNQANKNKGFRLHYLFYTFVAFVIGIWMIQLENYLSHSLLPTSANSFIYLILSGFSMSVGVVVPGVSSSVILMCLGIYDVYLHAISSLDFSILIPMGIGLVTGCLLFLFIIRYLLKHYYCQTFYTIIGFVLGSILILFPGFTFDFLHIASFIGFILAFLLANFLENHSNQ